MTLPFFPGQLPTADDFNALAVKADLASPGGASSIGYGGTTVAAALAAVTAPSVTSVASKTGAVTLYVTDIIGAAKEGGDSLVNFLVKNATGSQHAIPLGQADARYAPIGGGGGGGGVSSVGLTLPADFDVTGSPVTGAGVLAAAWSAKNPNLVLAGPASGGAPGTPVFRSLVPADVPTLNQNTTGTAGSITGVLGYANGGTGQAGRQLALNALTDAGAAPGGYVLTKDPSDGLVKMMPNAAGGSFVQAGTGAVTRTMQAKVRESVSVKDFGAVGDGVVDDTNACQLALNSVSVNGGRVYFPSGKYRITSSLILPLQQITVYGDGPSTLLFSAGTIFTYPLGVYIPGYIAVQNIENMLIEQTGNGTSVVMTQTWDALGKIGPTISGVIFYHSSLTTTSAISLRMQGVWSAAVTNCWFIGRGDGGGPTTGIGGYGIRMVPGMGNPTNIMNTIIANNTFLTMAYPIYMDMRAAVGGGVIEGIKIVGNNLAAGWQGITTNWSLATSITGNQVSDYQTCIRCCSDFEMSITGNSELHGTLSGINLVSGSVGFGATERITIAANNVGGQGTFSGGSGVRLTNLTANDQLRSIVISGNSFRGQPGSTANGYGVSFEGSNAINSVSMTGNSFGYLLAGFWFSGAGHAKNCVVGNTFSNVATEFVNLAFAGTNGGQVSGWSSGATGGRYLIQVGGNLTSAAPVITFPIPFKAGTVPAVFITPVGTLNTTMEAPSVSNVSNTFVEIQKKQFNGAIVLTNYQIVWVAVGEAA